MQHQLDQKDEALYTKDQSFEVNEQLLRRKVKSEAAFVCNICIMSIKRSSLRRALDTWQRVVFESNIKRIHEYTDQELEAQSQAVERMQLEAQKKQGEKELRNRESILIELRGALGKERSVFGRTMDNVEIRKQELEEGVAKVSRRESILAKDKDADEIQLGHVKNEELSKRLDEEKRKLFCVEEESKLSASRREEDLNEKEKKLSAQEEKKRFPEIAYYCKIL